MPLPAKSVSYSPTPRSISRGVPVNTAVPPGTSAGGMQKRSVLPLSRQGYTACPSAAPPVPVIQAVSPSRRHCPPMARMQSMVASMSWLWAMPRMRLSPDASAAHSSMRCPQLFDGGAAAVPAALPG